MDEYLRILKKVRDEGILKPNRTGIDCIAIFGETFEHDMEKGFPFLTTKKMPSKMIFGENEFFIKGITDKRWLQKRNIHIWDEWASPNSCVGGIETNMDFNFRVNKAYQKSQIQLKNGLILKKSLEPRFKELEQLCINFNSDSIGNLNLNNDKEFKAGLKLIQLTERDLGPIYGYQWRNFDGTYTSYDNFKKNGSDQLKNLVETIKKNPMDRRMIVNAWNPNQLSQMALPPCHYEFQVGILGDKINLEWSQRSVDTPIGLPFNIAGYATILHLLSLGSGYKPGKLRGSLKDVHIYKNQLDGVEEQLSRKPKTLCDVVTDNFTSIFDWKYEQTKRINYDCDERKIDFGNIAV